MFMKPSAAFTILVLLTAGLYADPPPAPTFKNIRYSKKFKRSVLDFWKADSKKNTPLIVFFHGGGFKAGDKAAFRRRKILARYLKKGISFASANYPLLKSANYLEIMNHTAESIRFLKEKEKEWNIDPRKIAVMGSSAGAMICEYLAYWEDLGITACFALEQPHHSWFLLARVSRPAPPLILYTSFPKDNKVHNPKYARIFKDYFDNAGIPCLLYGSMASGLPRPPRGKTIEDIAMRVFRKQWKKPAPEKPDNP